MRSISAMARPARTPASASSFILRLSARPRSFHICNQCRFNSTAAQTSTASSQTVQLNGKTYNKDAWFNLSPTVLSSMNRQLHLQNDHPISVVRQIIESQFPAPTYRYYNTHDPVVSTYQNFDSLGFPKDHVGRNKTDTYYVNHETVLRTHTSAHQADTFRANASEGFLISADVYRRDAIDRSHFPVFHQMEGARMWDRKRVKDGDIAKAVWEDIEKLPKHDMKVEDPHPPFNDENPLQVDFHSAAEAEAIGAHLKRSLELMINEIFTWARKANMASGAEAAEPLRVRWIEAYFPFTSPSWELEVFWQGDWLEVLGCGVVKQQIPINAGVPDQVGWAFGIGLERIAMLLFDIPDIRLFWSQDERFLSQFTGLSSDLNQIRRYVPFSKHPSCYKDVSFWLKSTSAAGGNDKASAHDFHENDVMEIIRNVGGNSVEDVRLLDEFTHPKTGRRSMCYRINYGSFERTLTNEETNDFHEKVREGLVKELGVELR